MNHDKKCLIITATIIPNSSFVFNNDYSSRREEYLNVLRHYSAQFLGHIYFVENSEYDFSKDEEFIMLFKKDNLFYIGLPKSDQFHRGKGYQEFQVLDQVVSSLEGRYTEFIKVSGRYLTINFTKLLKQANKGIIVDRHKLKKVAITSLFICRIDFYNKFLKNCYNEVYDNEGVFIEHVIYNKLKKISQENIDIFRTTPIFEGVSGSYGGGLNRHPIKTLLINVERRCLRIRNENELKKEFK